MPFYIYQQNCQCGLLQYMNCHTFVFSSVQEILLEGGIMIRGYPVICDNYYVIWDMLSEICDLEIWGPGHLRIKDLFDLVYYTPIFKKSSLLCYSNNPQNTETNPPKIYTCEIISGNIYWWQHQIVNFKFLKKKYFTVCFGNGTIERKWGRSVMNGRCRNFALWSSRQ